MEGRTYKEEIKDWLKTKVNIEDVEKENTCEIGPDKIGHPVKEMVVFGYVNNQWLRLKEQWLPGDELWYFSSSTTSFMSLCGRAGYCIMRNGEVVDFVFTRMS